MAKEVFPSTTKCCCKYKLTRIAVAVYITIEIYLWAFISIACIYTEFKMFENFRAFKFENFTKTSTYYAIVFGSFRARRKGGENVDNNNDDEVEEEEDEENDSGIGQGVIGQL